MPTGPRGAGKRTSKLDTPTVAKLVAELLIAIHGLSDYPVPAEQPSVEFVAHEVLEREACGGPCAIYGWYPPGQTIYLDDRLDPANDVGDRSILVHELVHYLQQESGPYTGHLNCGAWTQREGEAFDIQIRWLREQGVPLWRLRRYGRMPVRYSCGEHTAPSSD